MIDSVSILGREGRAITISEGGAAENGGSTELRGTGLAGTSTRLKADGEVSLTTKDDHAHVTGVDTSVGISGRGKFETIVESEWEGELARGVLETLDNNRGSAALRRVDVRLDRRSAGDLYFEMVALSTIKIGLEESDVVVVTKGANVAREDGRDTGSSDSSVGRGGDSRAKGHVSGEAEEFGDVHFDVERIKGRLAAVEALIVPRDDGLLSRSLATRARETTGASGGVRDLVVGLPDVMTELTALDVAETNVGNVFVSEIRNGESKTKRGAKFRGKGISRGGCRGSDGIFLETGKSGEEGVRAHITTGTREVVDIEHISRGMDVASRELHLREVTIGRASGNRASSVTEITASDPGVNQLSLSAEIDLEVLSGVHRISGSVETVRDNGVGRKRGEDVGTNGERAGSDGGRGNGDGVRGSFINVEVVLHASLILARNDEVTVTIRTSGARLVSPSVSGMVLVIPHLATSRSPKLNEEVVTSGGSDGVVLAVSVDDASIRIELSSGRIELHAALKRADIHRQDLSGDLVVVDGVRDSTVNGDVRSFVMAPVDSATTGRVGQARGTNRAVILNGNDVITNVHHDAASGTRSRGLGIEVLEAANVELIDLIALQVGKLMIVINLLTTENGHAGVSTRERDLRLEEIEDELRFDDSHGVVGTTNDLDVRNLVKIDTSTRARENALRASALASNSAARTTFTSAGVIVASGGIAGIPVFVDIDASMIINMDDTSSEVVVRRRGGGVLDVEVMRLSISKRQLSTLSRFGKVDLNHTVVITNIVNVDRGHEVVRVLRSNHTSTIGDRGWVNPQVEVANLAEEAAIERESALAVVAVVGCASARVVEGGSVRAEVGLVLTNVDGGGVDSVGQLELDLISVLEVVGTLNRINNIDVLKLKIITNRVRNGHDAAVRREINSAGGTAISGGDFFRGGENGVFLRSVNGAEVLATIDSVLDLELDGLGAVVLLKTTDSDPVRASLVLVNAIATVESEEIARARSAGHVVGVNVAVLASRRVSVDPGLDLSTFNAHQVERNGLGGDSLRIELNLEHLKLVCLDGGGVEGVGKDGGDRGNKGSSRDVIGG